MSHRLQVLIPKELDARIRKAASRDRVSKGEWVRQAIEERLARQAAKLPADPLAATKALRLSAPRFCLTELNTFSAAAPVTE